MYQSAKSDQGHRFSQTVCCNMVMGFTMTHDPDYKDESFVVHSQSNPIININNSNDNNIKTGDVNNTSNATNTNKSENTNSGMTPAQRKVKEARMEAHIQAGRFSEAEVIAEELK